LPLDETELERIFRNVRRTDLVPEVVIVIFHPVLPEYLQTEQETELAASRRGRGGSRIGTVEPQHPLLPLDIIDNI
jgi:hypothetical protein